ncbi:SDR family oxidoreductase [Roseiconus lacunae]|uniref:SDR family oxidoreductase n=1 Tax=Roseiconus lacunae TaxID=2605694 RepID=A0ABT7PQ57_9BACT|nr:SDR family oxidoreductase [Roseiconus lacunae]MCD0462816.1 SDR family oxidoreductase [Roseiconus lacunae]MDM4018640.1 SDR family oxidoreductase [Roseiconus lacunae]
MNKPEKILVCGATGYVGGRLVRQLLDEGYEVVCLVRSPGKLAKFSWNKDPKLRVVEGGINDEDKLRSALEGVDVAYYLVHSMQSAGGSYAERDRELATAFLRAAEESSCRRIIYLGGLGELGENLSNHLNSRREVADILQGGTIETTVFRAAMIIGSGSASFETLRYLVERLPIMITPRWVTTETQPIAIRDVLRYLVDCLTIPETAGRTIDIGGRGVMTYQQIMQIAANKLGLSHRKIFPIPVLTPKLSSLWIGLVTPVSSRIARPLAEGLRNRTVCRNDDALKLMPGECLTIEDAIEAAIGRTREGLVETRWSTAGEMPHDPDWAGGTTLKDERSVIVDAPVEDTFDEIKSIGGQHGYWGAGPLWTLRGWLDQLIGGPGLRRGRRHPTELHFGEAVDFWRVTKMTPNEQLRLRAEMWLPGEAELDFVVSRTEEDASRIDMTARFRPRGLLGLAYWYSVYPLHWIVFPVMLRGIKRAVEKDAAS